MKLTQGRRICAEPGKDLLFERPGDYGLSIQPNGERWWYATLPNWTEENEMWGHYICIHRPGATGHHSVVEHEDGTITISPPILWGAQQMPLYPKTWWHGFLEHGVWREC